MVIGFRAIHNGGKRIFSVKSTFEKIVRLCQLLSDVACHFGLVKLFGSFICLHITFWNYEFQRWWIQSLSSSNEQLRSFSGEVTNEKYLSAISRIFSTFNSSLDNGTFWNTNTPKRLVWTALIVLDSNSP